MASPVTLGALTKGKTREESPIPGDLYTLSVPISVQGTQRGTMRLEFFVADGKTNQELLAFLGGENPPDTGPYARWDV